MTDLLTHPAELLPQTGRAVEIHDGTRWVRVCELDDLLPDRGAAVLVDGAQVALFRDAEGELFALDNRDPFSGAHVLSRGLLGSRGRIRVLISPMHKQAFALHDGTCLDEATAPDGTSSTLRSWPVRLSPESSGHSGSPGPAGPVREP